MQINSHYKKQSNGKVSNEHASLRIRIDLSIHDFGMREVIAALQPYAGRYGKRSAHHRAC
jgi:hypothetical protein